MEEVFCNFSTNDSLPQTPLVSAPTVLTDISGGVFLKKCSKCGIEKSLEEFYGYRNNPDKKHPWCILCEREKQQNWYYANQDKCLNRSRVYKKENPEKVKAWRLKNKENARIKRSENRRNNKEKFIFDLLRKRMQGFLKYTGQAKLSSTKELLGCDKDFLREYLGYTGDPTKNIDHYVPMGVFPLSEHLKEISFKIMCNYRNLQMLDKSENFKKWHKLPRKWKEKIIKIGEALSLDVSEIIAYIESNIKPNEEYWEKDYFSIR